MKTLISSVNRSPLRCGFFTVAIALCWFALSPPLKAQCPSACGAGGNTAVGVNALDSVTTGINNTGVGANALTDDTTGSYNVGVGVSALRNNTTGFQNLALGAEALLNNNGNFNLAMGFRTGYLNTIGNRLTGIGAAALRNNTTASDNTAIGATALRENATGEENTAIGSGALSNLNGSDDNTAVGSSAVFGLTSGVENVGVGKDALRNLTTGANWNTGIGTQALLNVSTGDHNTALGEQAGDAVTTGNNNIRIGAHSGDTEAGTVSNTICIGESGDTNGGENTPNRTYIGNIVGVAVGGPFPSVPVIIDQDGQLGTVVSSRRFKKDIKPMDQASEAILKLKPVTFRYKIQDKKNDQTPEFGLIAEDVDQVNPDLVVPDKEGKPFTVRYDAVNVMLLNEFIKEHKKVEAQQASIAELKSTVALQQKAMQVFTAQLKEQAAQIQKVSAQVELNKPAPSTVANK